MCEYRNEQTLQNNYNIIISAIQKSLEQIPIDNIILEFLK